MQRKEEEVVGNEARGGGGEGEREKGAGGDKE